MSKGISNLCLWRKSKSKSYNRKAIEPSEEEVEDKSKK